jgi:hypothetical protein
MKTLPEVVSPQNRPKWALQSQLDHFTQKNIKEVDPFWAYIDDFSRRQKWPNCQIAYFAALAGPTLTYFAKVA